MKAMPHLEDDPVSQTRLNMVEGQLKPGGVRDYALTKMIGTVSREAFVASDVRAVAYADRELPAQAGDARRQLLSPLAFARLAELADLSADGSRKRAYYPKQAVSICTWNAQTLFGSRFIDVEHQ
ncbi:MAG: hypothetical protein VXW20_03680, partial [Pseudomonadota bacterium]|nr:hypothetical protein [Pseudomonadota bacterium]